MAGNPKYTDLLTTTIENRSRKMADNLTNNNALLRRLRDRGNIRTFGGGTVILEEIIYGDGRRARAYNGYDVLDTTPYSPITASEWAVKQYSQPITISGQELRANKGRERMIDLFMGRQMAAEGTLENTINEDLFGDGTADGGKVITGLSGLISTTPNTGIIGGINRANNAWWRNVAFDATTDGGAALTADNIGEYMTTVAMMLVRGSDAPDLIVADPIAYGMYVKSMQNIQRITSDGGGSGKGIGFNGVKFFAGGVSADVIMGGGIGNNGLMPAKSMYFLNTKYLFLRPHRDLNFAPIGGERESVNQDAIVKHIGWAGNMTASGLQFQGVLFDSAA